MRAHYENALAIAKYLEANERVEKVCFGIVADIRYYILSPLNEINLRYCILLFHHILSTRYT